MKTQKLYTKAQMMQSMDAACKAFYFSLMGEYPENKERLGLEAKIRGIKNNLIKGIKPVNKLIILLILVTCISCAPKLISATQQIDHAKQREQRKKDFVAIAVFCLVLYFGGKAMTNNFE